ncbi:hypothetical protein B0H12DRAFT_350703 [Mycena haematopus]|nr:hypothetical protein B0H12DRAFT_350703 [Mycena haematopus]
MGVCYREGPLYTVTVGDQLFMEPLYPSSNLQLSQMIESPTPIPRLTRRHLLEHPENLPSSSSFSYFASAISRPPSQDNVPSSSSFSYFSSANPPVVSRPPPTISSPTPTYVSCDIPLAAPAPLPGRASEFFDFDLAHLDGIRRQYPLKRKRIDDDEYHQRISPKRFKGPHRLMK